MLIFSFSHKNYYNYLSHLLPFPVSSPPLPPPNSHSPPFILPHALPYPQNTSKLTHISFNYNYYSIHTLFLMVTFETDPIIFAAVGGIILGLATSTNYIVRGKVTGMSGIVYGIVSLDKCIPSIMQPNCPKNYPLLEACSSFPPFFSSFLVTETILASNPLDLNNKLLTTQHGLGSSSLAF